MLKVEYLQSEVNISEQFNRNSYHIGRTYRDGRKIFRVLQNGTQSYYTFRHNCDGQENVIGASYLRHTIEVDNRTAAIVHEWGIHQTGTINVTLTENPSDPHSNKTFYLISNINMSRFMFQILAIEQNKKRLVAEANAVSTDSSKLIILDACTFTLDTADDTSDGEIELALIFSIMLDDMREGRTPDDEDKATSTIIFFFQIKVY